MSNSLTKFKDDVPPSDHVYLYWDCEDEKWRIWFADPEGTGETVFPMFNSGDYDRFDYKLHRFRLAADTEAGSANSRAPRSGGARAGEDTAWPLRDVLEKLADAANHLLGEHDCDCHGHEEIAQARDAARRIMAQMTTASAGSRRRR
jgi:hypothetical protein